MIICYVTIGADADVIWVEQMKAETYYPFQVGVLDILIATIQVI